jgi:hypothetical protein
MTTFSIPRHHNLRLLNLKDQQPDTNVEDFPMEDSEEIGNDRKYFQITQTQKVTFTF